MKRFVQMASFDVKLLFILHFISTTLSAPQQPEINDQFTTITAADATKRAADNVLSKVDTTKNFATNTEVNKYEKLKSIPEGNSQYFVLHSEVTEVDSRPTMLETIYEILTRPISKFLSLPKVSFVLRNVGTCVVNGVMEIISHFLPAPFIPLIASAAGMVIPFEPVVMLKEKMPVTSYRRAFRKAMSSFLNTFDAYKLDSFDDDPYMTRRFNRKFMDDISGEKKKKINDVD